MARKEKTLKLKMAQPDRSGLDPTHETLLEIAEQRNLLRAQQNREKEIQAEAAARGQEEDPEILVGRLGESVLWSISLTLLHLTLDVLVASQYAVSIEWDTLGRRTLQAFPVIFMLFYSFHPHPQSSILLPSLPRRIQPLAHQLFFFLCAISGGCYLIYITNTYSYYAVLKQAPPIGCLWIWSVIELNVGWASASLLVCGAFMKFGGYSIK